MKDSRVKRRFEKVLDEVLVKKAFHIGVYHMHKYIVIDNAPKIEVKYVIHFDVPEKTKLFKEEIKNSKLYSWGNIEIFGEWKDVIVVYSWNISEVAKVLEHEKKVLFSLGIDVGGSDEEDLRIIQEGYNAIFEELVTEDRFWGYGTCYD